MSPDIIVPVIARWAHIFAAIITLGGAIFLRFVLLPAAESALDEETHEKLRTAAWRRWQLLVHVSIGLLIVSGFYNFIVIMAPAHSGQSQYHMLFGIKFLLAMAVFLLAILLTSRKNYSKRFRDNSRLWLAVLIACSAAVVGISGVMKTMPRTDMVSAPATAETAEE